MADPYYINGTTEGLSSRSPLCNKMICVLNLCKRLRLALARTTIYSYPDSSILCYYNVYHTYNDMSIGYYIVYGHPVVALLQTMMHRIPVDKRSDRSLWDTLVIFISLFHFSNPSVIKLLANLYALILFKTKSRKIGFRIFIII